MAGNGDVAALIANVKPNYRHLSLSLSLIEIRHDTLLWVTSLHRNIAAAGTLLREGSPGSAAQLLEGSNFAVVGYKVNSSTWILRHPVNQPRPKLREKMIPAQSINRSSSACSM